MAWPYAELGLWCCEADDAHETHATQGFKEARSETGCANFGNGGDAELPSGHGKASTVRVHSDRITEIFLYRVVVLHVFEYCKWYAAPSMAQDHPKLWRWLQPVREEAQPARGVGGVLRYASASW